MGLQDEPYLEPQQQAQVWQRCSQIEREQLKQEFLGYQQRQQFMTSHPDYSQVVGQPNPVTGQFQPAQPLMKALQANPMLGQALQNSPMAHVLAYEIASKYKETPQQTQQRQQQQTQQQAQQAANAFQQAATSISGVEGTAGNVSKQAMVQGMSDAEFKQYIEDIKSQAM
jgi:hypothetical protein